MVRSLFDFSYFVLFVTFVENFLTESVHEMHERRKSEIASVIISFAT